MAEWFIKAQEAETEEGMIGPLRPSELLELVRSGQVTPETMLRKDDSAWFPAQQVGGLFEAAIRPTVLYFCPKCNVQIKAPPTMCPKCLREVTRAREEIIENSIADPEQERLRTQAGRSVQNWLKKKVRRKGDNATG